MGVTTIFFDRHDDNVFFRDDDFFERKGEGGTYKRRGGIDKGK